MDVLTGIRVVDVTAWAFVPAAGAILAHWGANVIKVEPTRNPDPGRIPGAARTAYWHYNRGKRGVALDLAAERRRAPHRPQQPDGRGRGHPSYRRTVRAHAGEQHTAIRGRGDRGSGTAVTHGVARTRMEFRLREGGRRSQGVSGLRQGQRAALKLLWSDRLSSSSGGGRRNAAAPKPRSVEEQGRCDDESL